MKSESMTPEKSEKPASVSRVTFVELDLAEVEERIRRRLPNREKSRQAYEDAKVVSQHLLEYQVSV